MTTHVHRSMPLGPAGLRIVALVLLGVPASVLLLFALGEILGGDITGVQHIPEAAILLVLMGAAWRRSRATGLFLVVTTSLLYVMWLGWVLLLRNDEGGTPAVMWIATSLLLFLPPLLAGCLLLWSAPRQRDR